MVILFLIHDWSMIIKKVFKKISVSCKYTISQITNTQYKGKLFISDLEQQNEQQQTVQDLSSSMRLCDKLLMTKYIPERNRTETFVFQTIPDFAWKPKRERERSVSCPDSLSSAAES